MMHGQKTIKLYLYLPDCRIWSDVRSGHKRLLQENSQLKKDAKA
jgi:hypothetical protein